MSNRFSQFATTPKSDNRFASFGQPIAAPEPATNESRGITGITKDLGVSFATGSNMLLEMAGNLYGLTTGDMDNFAANQGARGQEYWNTRKSPQLQAMEQERKDKIDATEGEFSKGAVAFWETIKSPSLLSSFLVEQAPNLLVTGGAGRAAGGLVQAGAKQLGKEVSEKAVATAAVSGALGTGGAMHGSDVGAEAYDKLLELPDDVWLANPDIQQMINGNLDLLPKAKEQIALNLAQNSAIAAGILSIGLNKLPGADYLEKALSGVKLPAGSFTGSVLKGYLGETLSEGAEEGSGALLSNYATSRIDPTQSLTEGVGEATGMGMSAGPLGAITGALGSRRENEEADPSRSIFDDPVDTSTPVTPPVTPASPQAPLQQRLSENQDAIANIDKIAETELLSPQLIAMRKQLQAEADSLREQMEKAVNEPLGAANEAVIQAGERVREQGGDELDVTIAQAKTAVDVVPRATVESQARATELFAPPIEIPAQPQTRVADMPTWQPIPQTRDQNASDLGITFPEAPAPISTQSRQPGAIPPPTQRESSTVDQMISTAERMGLTEEVARLTVAKRVLSAAERAPDERQAIVYRTRGQAIVDNVAAKRPELTQRVTQEVTQQVAQQVAPEVTSEVEPRLIDTWTGRRGNGYQTLEDAEAGMVSRQQKQPDLDWRIEQMPSGRFQLAGYSAPQGRTGRLDQPATQPAIPAQSVAQSDTQAVTAPAQISDMEVEFDGRRFPVNSIEDAQQKWTAFREQSNAGASDIGPGIPVYRGGQQVARISYNSRAWTMDGKDVGGMQSESIEAPRQAELVAATSYQQGDRVQHNDGSTGRVVSASGDMVSVQFDGSTNPPRPMVSSVFKPIVADQESATDASPDVEQASATEPPALIYMKSGQPFRSEKVARASTQFRSAPGSAVVPVEGGYAIQAKPAETAMPESIPAQQETNQIPEVDRPVLQNRDRSTPASFDEVVDAGISNKEGNAAYHVYRAITSDEAAVIKESTGIDVEGFEHGIDESAVRHILKEHGNAQTEAKKGQLPITREDVALVPEITVAENIDTEGSRPRSDDALASIRYKKQVNGHILIVEEVRDGRKRLALKTMWKVRAAPNATAENQQPPAQTPEAFRAQPSTQNTVSQNDSAGETTPATELMAASQSSTDKHKFKAPAKPRILRVSRDKYTENEIKDAKERLNEDSPEYKKALESINSRHKKALGLAAAQYEQELDRTYANLSFEQYNELNKDTPESINRQAYTALREEFGVTGEVSVEQSPAPEQMASQEAVSVSEKQNTGSNTLSTQMSGRDSAQIFERFNNLGSEKSVSLEQTLEDVESIMGFYSPFDVQYSGDLDSLVPMAFDLDNRVVLVNSNLPMNRADAAQFMVEEVLHGIDATGGNRTISASSKLLEQGGAIREEAQQAFDDGILQNFLTYPLDRVAYETLSDDRVKAELFARLGVLYLGEPQLMREALPNAYSTYDSIFGLEKESPVSGDYVFRKIWRDSTSKRGQVRGEYRTGDQVRSDGARTDSQGGAGEGLGRIRQAVGRILQGSPLGIRANLRDMQTRPGAGFSVSGEIETRETDKGVALFSRQSGRSVSIPLPNATAIVNGITGRLNNAPDVIVVQSMQDEKVPEAVRTEDAKQRSQGAQGDPEGFYYDGKAYIVLDGLSRRRGESDAQAIVRVYAHEVLGHAGLRGFFRSDLDKILSEVSVRRRADVSRKADEYGLNMKNRDDRLTAAEEVLAEMAQSEPENSLVTKAVEAIRKALHRLFMSLPADVRKVLNHGKFVEWINGMSDAEIIDRFIVPARQYIRDGAMETEGEAVPVFSRDPSALTGHPRGATIAVSEQQKQSLLQKHGRELDEYLNSEFGFGIDALTHGEAAQALSAPSLDEIRSRITAAQSAAGIGPDRSDAGTPPVRFSRTATMEYGEGRSESEFAAENRRLREEDKTLWDKGKKLLRKGFSPGGLLPDSVFREKIARDGQLGVVEITIQGLVRELETSVRKEFGAQLRHLNDADKRRLSDALAGKMPANMKPRTKVAIVAMRQYMDRLSQQYVDILDQQVTDLTGSFDTGEQTLFDAFMQMNEIEPASDSPADKGAATKRQNAILDAAKESARDIWGDGKPMQKALEKVAVAAQKASLMNTIINNQGQYVHRSYQVFDDPKWFKHVDTEVVDAARRYLAQRYREDGELSRDEISNRVEAVISDILKNGTAYDSMEAFVKESKLGAKDLSVLKRRKDIAPEIRALMGEHVDPRINFAKSATKMGRLIFNQKFLDTVREQGMGAFLFTEDNRPPGTEEIAAEGSEVYSPLNGLYTFKETNQAFKDALGKANYNKWWRTIIQINGMIKGGKTILSPTTSARNFQSALFFSLANGHFDLSQAKKSMALINKFSDQEKLAYVKKMKELGVIYDSPYAEEMMDLLRESKADTFFSDNKTAEVIRSSWEFARDVYSFGDDFWKVIGFENEKALLIKHAGMTEAQAEKEAAERIRNTYPTYSMVGQAIQWLRRFPLVGTFVSFPAEIVRTTFNMAKLVKKDWDTPGMRPIAARRAVGMSFVAGFAYAAQEIAKAAFDIDDDDEEAIRLQAAPWQRNSNIVPTGRDENGNLRYVDISFLDPYNYFKRPITALLRDQPLDDALLSGVADMLSPFLGTDIAVGALMEVYANKSATGGRVFKESDTVDQQLLDIGDHLRKAVQPGIMSNLERTYKAMKGDRSASGKQYNMTDEGLSWVGWRVSTLEPKTALYYRSFEFGDAKSDATKTLTEVLTSSNDVSAKEIESAYERSMKMRERAYEDMIKLVRASQKSGLSDTDIRRVLKASSVSSADARALLTGTIPPWVPTRQSEQAAMRRAEALIGREKAMEIRDRYRQARVIGR